MQNPYQNRGGFSEHGQMGYSGLFWPVLACFGLFWPVLACFGPGERSSAHKKPRERSSAHKQPRERSSAHKKPRERNYAPARSCFGQSGSSNAQWLHIEHWFTWDKLTPHAGPGVDPDRGRSELVCVKLKESASLGTYELLAHHHTAVSHVAPGVAAVAPYPGDSESGAKGPGPPFAGAGLRKKN